MSTHEIAVRTDDGRTFASAVTADGTTGQWSIQLTVNGAGEFGATAGDVFECLLHVRRQLEPLGYRLLINGARRDCWPSGMARDMGGGMVVYRMEIGRQAQREDLLRVFDPAAESDVGTVAEQEAFARTWFEFFENRHREHRSK